MKLFKMTWVIAVLAIVACDAEKASDDSETDDTAAEGEAPDLESGGEPTYEAQIFKVSLEEQAQPADGDLSSSSIFYRDTILSLADRKGSLWNLGDGQWSVYSPLVASTGLLLTNNDESFWEIEATEFRHSIASDVEKFELAVFEIEMLTEIEGFRVLQYTKDQLVGVFNTHIFLFEFADGQLKVKTIQLPTDPTLVLGGGLLGAVVWIAEASKLHWVDLERQKWVTDALDLSGAEDVEQMALQLSLEGEHLVVKSMSVIAGDVLLTSKEIKIEDVPPEEIPGSEDPENPVDPENPDDPLDPENPDDPVDIWFSVIKPSSDVACLSCHSGPQGYETKANWIANKCTLIDRLAIANKAIATTMPPAFADAAQIEHMDGEGDAKRKEMLAWLETLDGECQ